MPTEKPRGGAALAAAALTLTLLATPAFPDPPRSRDEAVVALQHAAAGKRAEAIVWIANHGSMRDADRLHERLRDDSPAVRGYAEQGLWLLWSRSGNADIDRLMASGVEAMQSGKFEESIGIFSEVISRRPDFAEGWNKRATAYFLAREYRKSIADCDQVLKRNPKHFGALSGLGQIYSALEEDDKALEWFRRALEVNPNMAGVELQIRILEGKVARERRLSI